MDTSTLISLVIIGGLGVVLYKVAAAPSDSDKQMAEDIIARQWRCPSCGSTNNFDIHECTCGHELTTLIDPDPPEVVAGAKWRLWGAILIFCGLAGLGFGLFMDTSVETYIPTSLLGEGGRSDVVNLDLLFRKGTVISCGLVGAGIGVFCLAIGAVLDALGQNGRVQ